jgi:hypothetical protein
MGKFVEIRIELDENVPESMAGIIRCGSVRAYDANGKLCKDWQDLVDQAEYHSEREMIFAVAKRLKFPADMISIER